MDIDTIPTVDEDTPVFVHFKDLEGKLLFDVDGDKKTPVGADVVGTYSSYFADAKKRMGESAKSKYRAGGELDPEAGAFELEAALIRRWTFTSGGKALAINGPNWQALIVKQPQWREQVNLATSDHARFFTKS